MRDDDRMLNDAARAVLAGGARREDYGRLWTAVMDERRGELAQEVAAQECGHPWVDGLRRWVDGQPTSETVCRICGAESGRGRIDQVSLVVGG
jgi:hypothetical protein